MVSYILFSAVTVFCLSNLIIASLDYQTGVLVAPLDLTWGFDNMTFYWPMMQPFIFTEEFKSQMGGDKWFALNNFAAGEHGGTHIDAPYHFNENGLKVGEIPIENLIVPGVTISLVNEALYNPRTALTPYHLEEWVSKYGPFPYGCVILINFGWSRYITNRTAYYGSDSQDAATFVYPGITKEAAEWIVQTGHIIGVGVDTPSMDVGGNTGADAHRVLLGANLYGIESVKMPPNMPAHGFTLLVMPMKITYGTGAPTRVVALPNHQSYPSLPATLQPSLMSRFYKK